MRVDHQIFCKDFPCADVIHQGFCIPAIEIDPLSIKLILISESAPADAKDFYYAQGHPHFEQTTITAFQDAGVKAHSMQDLLRLGVYCTPAVKCAKTGYGIKTETIKTCSALLEDELNLFPNTLIYLLMGDVAIKAINMIAKRNNQPRVIPAGSTYKIRGEIYSYQGKRVFPSYLQAGPSFNIEKSKRRMIAEDIRSIMSIISEN